MSTKMLRDVAIPAPLEECAQLRSGKTPSRNRPEFWSGTIPWFSAKDLKSHFLKDSKEHISQAAIADGAPIGRTGELLVLVRGMTLLKNVPVGVLCQDASFNQDLKCLRALDGISSGYLGYMLAASKPRLMSMVDKAGHGTGRLAVERLLSLPIWMPSPDVQEFVETTLRCVDNHLALSQRLITAKRVFKRGLMHELLTGTTRLPQFARSGWKTVNLGDVLTYTPRKVPKPAGTFLSAGVRSHGKGVFLKEDFPAEGIALDELFVLRHHDLTVNITFGWEGAVAIVPVTADGALVSHRFPTYEFDQTKALPEYFRHVIRTRRFVFDIACASPGGAGRNRVLNRQEFLEIPVKLPSRAEQEEIAGILDAIDREIELLEQLHQQVTLQKRALFSRLLSGEISVPV